MGLLSSTLRLAETKVKIVQALFTGALERTCHWLTRSVGIFSSVWFLIQILSARVRGSLQPPEAAHILSHEVPSRHSREDTCTLLTLSIHLASASQNCNTTACLFK